MLKLVLLVVTINLIIVAYAESIYTSTSSSSSSSSASATKSFSRSSSKSTSSSSSTAIVSKTCPKNETYVDCLDYQCQPQNCSDLGVPIVCPAITPGAFCKNPGCICNEGLLRNDRGKCIPKTECPSCGGDSNAIAGCGLFCGTRCSTYKKGPLPCAPICYFNSCDCKPGYVYDDNTGKCVQPDKCTPTCGEYEEFSECINGGCSAKNCTELGYPKPCVKRHYKSCIKGCVCISGYLRAENGTCVPTDECGICGGDKNASPGCGVNCGPKCSDLNSKINIANTACPECALNGCKCNDGYIYDENVKKCVKPEKCTPTCGKDEIFNFCVNGGCGKRNCSQIDEPDLCIDLIEGACKQGCICKDGFLRAKNGTCILKEQCPSKCKGQNEVYNPCPPTCPKSQGCDIIGKIFECPLMLANQTNCEGTCRCKPGYYRNKLGQCITKKQCSQCTKGNETYNPCPGCAPNTCESIGKTYHCLNPVLGSDRCNGTCQCAPGFYRNELEECVTKKQCSQCKGQFEAYDPCPPVCPPQTCDSIGQVYSCPAMPSDPALRSCNGTCRCLPGYYRNTTGQCVTQDECQTCPANERWEQCPDYTCTFQKCSQLGYLTPCVYLLAEGAKCPTKPACICVDGYLRNDEGKCVPKKQCPSCGGDPNAESTDCGNNCGRQCSDYNKGPVACPEYCILGGCTCKKGYVFDQNINKCVLPKQCTPVCKENEIFSNCTNGGCGKKNCTQIGQPDICVDLIEGACKKGCLCKDGYLRADNGTCVPQNQCPLKCDKPHEYFACGKACDNVCATLKTQNQTNCPIINKTCNRKCYCEKGYARDEKDNCIPIEQCDAKTCQKNEVYSQCANGFCGLRNCSQYGQPIPYCPKFDESKCEGGCICKPKYLRAKNKTCIPQEQCKPKTCQKNEVYSQCANGFCGLRNCSQYGQPIPYCPKFDESKCKGGCICNPKYLRAKNGTCIPEEQCKPSPNTCKNVVDIQDDLNKGNAAFTGKFLYEIFKNQPGSSLIASPFSVLFQLALYSSGSSLNQLLQVLNLKNKDQIRCVFPNLIKSYENQTSVQFDLAAKIYANIQYALSKEFKKDSKDIFDAEAQNLDFSKSTQAARIINDWVLNNTNNRIKDLVSPQMLNNNTRLVLVNAIYFKGNWKLQFDPRNTKSRDFYVTKDKIIQVETMYQREKINYAENKALDSQIVQLFYNDSDFSYYVFLPRKIDGINNLVQKLQNSTVLYKAIDTLTPQTVMLYLPKYNTTATTDLSTVLKKTNVTSIFNANTSGLEGILEKQGNQKLAVTAAIQKAFIIVNEKGSEATAANAIGVGSRRPSAPPPPPITFKADHPFVYFISLRRTILFGGVFAR